MRGDLAAVRRCRLHLLPPTRRRPRRHPAIRSLARRRRTPRRPRGRQQKRQRRRRSAAWLEGRYQGRPAAGKWWRGRCCRRRRQWADASAAGGGWRPARECGRGPSGRPTTQGGGWAGRVVGPASGRRWEARARQGIGRGGGGAAARCAAGPAAAGSSAAAALTGRCGCASRVGARGDWRAAAIVVALAASVGPPLVAAALVWERPLERSQPVRPQAD